VTTAFYDQPEIVLSRKVDRGDDVRSLSGSYGINAPCGPPSVIPSRDLCARRLVTDVEGVFEVLDRLAAGRPRGPILTGTQEWRHLEQVAIDGGFQPLPAF